MAYVSSRSMRNILTWMMAGTLLLEEEELEIKDKYRGNLNRESVEAIGTWRENRLINWKSNRLLDLYGLANRGDRPSLKSFSEANPDRAFCCSSYNDE